MKNKMKLAAVGLATLATTSTLLAQNPNPIRVNQVGYAPQDSKTAVVEQDGWSKKYTLVNEVSGKRVWKGKAVRTTTSPWSGKERAVLDFSSVVTPGTYLLSNGRDTQRVLIAQNPLRELSVASIKSFYLQRSGEVIESQYAGVYARPMGHADMQVMVHPSAASESRPAGTILQSPGGWYDAGDYNKYIVNSAYSVALMMDAYEMNKSYFDRLTVGIPESANQTPDLLDEIAVNLRWMLTMQDPADGGVYHKLTTPNFEGFIRPADCKQQRYVVMKSTAATLDFAATMAKAYRIYSQLPAYKEWAEGALKQAVAAYGWTERNPHVLYNQDAMNKQYDPDVVTGTYGDGHVADERMWAEVELFLSTGNMRYLQGLMQNPDALKFSNPSWGNVSGLAFYSAVAAAKGDGVPYAAEIADMLRSQIVPVANQYMATMEESAFDAPCGNSPRDFGWGCNGEQVCGKGIILLYAHALTGDARYLAGARKVADYLLGRNATGYCYVTGFGTFSPQHPHHRLSASDGIDAPLPGFLVGGPNPGWQDGLKNYPSKQPDESYLDVEESYASNEIAINWNAALVAFIGWLDALSM